MLMERVFVLFFEDLFGFEQVGFDDDFFVLGGYFLVVVCFFVCIKKQFGEEYLLFLFFEVLIVCQLVQRIWIEVVIDEEMIEWSEGFRYFVLLYCVEGLLKCFFFIVLGMFGNVFNFCYFVCCFGDDQQVYVLQVRGFYGEVKLYDCFEDMVIVYFEEVWVL